MNLRSSTNRPLNMGRPLRPPSLNIKADGNEGWKSPRKKRHANQSSKSSNNEQSAPRPRKDITTELPPPQNSDVPLNQSPVGDEVTSAISTEGPQHGSPGTKRHQVGDRASQS